MSGLQWVLDAYTIVFAGLLLPAGSLLAKKGERSTPVSTPQDSCSGFSR